MTDQNGMIHPYQGKDIVSKILTNTFGNKTFEVYGIKNLPAIKEYLPTELPTIEASDRVSDHIFRLADDSIAIVDYESAYKSTNGIKYLEYVTRLAKTYFARDSRDSKVAIRLIVIYTCDVESAEDTFEYGAVTLKVQQAFLTHIDGIGEFNRIMAIINSGGKLADEDLMKLVILPLTRKGREAKAEMIDEVISAATLLMRADDTAASFVLSAMFVATGNYITEKQENRIKEVLDMTSLGLRYEREAQEREEHVRNLTRAEDLVDSVESIASNGNMSIEDACRIRGTKKDMYELAKDYIKKSMLVAAQ